MKQILICCLVLSFAINSLAQYADTSTHTVATDYFKKSKNQKTAAWILLGSGGVASVTGLVIYTNSIKNSTNPFEFLKGKGA